MNSGGCQVKRAINPEGTTQHAGHAASAFGGVGIDQIRAFLGSSVCHRCEFE